MKRSIFFILMILFSTLSFAQSQYLKNYGDELGNYYTASTVDRDGNMYLTGSFNNTITLDGLTATGGSNALFTAKFNSDGDINWLKTENSGTQYTPYDIALVADGGYLMCGTFYGGDGVFGDLVLPESDLGNTFIVKYDHNGNAMWAVDEVGYGYYTKITVDADGNIIVIGSLYGDFSFDGINYPTFGEYDAMYAKYSSTGSPMWIKVFGGLGSEDLSCLTTDDDNNIILGGRFSSDFEFEGHNFNVVALGDNFIMKSDENGYPIWLNLIASNNDESQPEGVAIGPDNNIYLGVTVENETHVDAIEILTLGLTDACLMQLNPENGAVNWYKTGGGYEYDYVHGIQAAKDGIFLIGTYSGTAEFDGLQLTDAFSGAYLTSFDYNGNALSVRGFTGESFVSINDVNMDAHGNIYCSGLFYEDVISDGLATLVTNGGVDIYAYKETSPLVNITEVETLASIELSPNPTTNTITISTENDFLKTIKIVDQNGAVIKLLSSTNQSNTMNVSDLAPGLYFVLVTSGDALAQTKSFVKQ